MTTEKGRKPRKDKPRGAEISKPEAAPASPEAVQAPQPTSEPAPPKPARRVTTQKGRGPSRRKPGVAKVSKPEAARSAAAPEAVQAPQPPSEPTPAPGPVFVLPEETPAPVFVLPEETPAPVFVLPEEEVEVVESQPELKTRAARQPAEGAGQVAQEALVSPADERWLVAADLGSLCVIGGLVFLNIAGTVVALRLVLALLFVTFVPGWALARAAGLAGGLTGVAVAVLASLTIGAAASTVMVWANIWHPLMLLAGLGALSAVAILWTLPPAFVAARLRR